MHQRECEFCGRAFQIAKQGKSRFCSSQCALDDRAAREPKKQHVSELDRFMAQPEIAQLRAGIQCAIRAAWTRCFGG